MKQSVNRPSYYKLHDTSTSFSAKGRWSNMFIITTQTQAHALVPFLILKEQGFMLNKVPY